MDASIVSRLRLWGMLAIAAALVAADGAEPKIAT